MNRQDLGSALLVVLVWGMNFVVIKVGLHGLPPMLLGALRFILAAVPAIFFVRRPAVPWRLMLAYGLTAAFGQFAFLFWAMSVGMPAGAASVVLQAQAFFTIAFAALMLGERWRAQHVVGLLIAAVGLALIAEGGGQDMNAVGFMLTLAAAASWAAGNICMKKIGRVDLLGLIVWSSLIPPLPFALASLVFEGPDRIGHALANIEVSSLLALAYLAFAATLLGYSLWGRLLTRYPAAQVAPLSLLVPILGIASSSLLLHEHFARLQWLGAAFVLGGLLVNVYGPRLIGRQ
ncbi:EamA family transporter [Chitinasiproducens palmae]|uniref:O-acetylserine/cysteine efflux transporter n=1 Tax=Chitinasiproducens palmae TaxID=1770053 RepID=A0A1H2PWK8_9BURK|nr:EamA family transporter [Chitinasiproducens palmae]SDV50939.1 O-acetylserine/cysteine efflux transporter [Chitinasiproducens palmae]